MITEQLIKRCQSKERAAQKKLYEVLLPYLNVVCQRYLNHEEELQDVLQEAFINLFTHINKYDPRRSQFKTWAVKIAINCCLKANKRMAKMVTDEFNVEQHSQVISPEVLGQLSDADLLAFLKTMPPSYFEVFNLFVIDGFNHKEIAGMLSIDESLSRKRLSRAREWLFSKNGMAIIKDLGLRKLN